MGLASRESFENSVPKQVKWEEWFTKQWRNRTLKAEFVQWICTYKCNFKCRHCGTAAGQAREDELNTSEILKAVDSLGKIGCRMFSVTGGEPLLRPDIFDVLGHAKSKGMSIGIVTNGYATEDYIEQLKKIQLNSVLISIDGYGENHEKIRGTKGSYEKCLKSLDLYYELKVPVRSVSTIMLDDNVDDMPKIIEDVWKHHITNQRIQPLVPEGRAKGTKNNPETIKKVLRIIHDAREKGINVEMSEGFGRLGLIEERVRSYDFFCGCGWNTFTIMHDGNIMGCPALDYPELGEGNIREKDLERIWWNGFDKFRKTVLEDLPKKCKECRHVQACRGGCWLFRANNADPCFLKEAEEVASELGYK
ncbi:MAG: radical SAM protein [Candidatus Omnitrophica bacterium]|nr:radical SAM protein [Candidatus Omnitrophota bacterium]